MESLFDRIKRNPSTAALDAAVRSGALPVYGTGLCESYKLFVTDMLCRDRQGFVVVPDAGEAQRLRDLFSVLLDPAQVLVFEGRDYVFYNFENISRTSELARISTLARLMRDDWRICIVPADAAAQLLPSPARFARNSLTVDINSACPRDELIAFLAGGGYTRAELIEGPGQFAVRGGMVEFFSPAQGYPVRVEYFGDDIDSLALFDPSTQRRVEDIERATALPVVEVIPDAAALERVQAIINKHAARLKRTGGDEEARLNSLNELEAVRGLRFPAVDRYLPAVLDDPASVFDYVPDALCLCYDLARVRQAWKGFAFKTGEDISACALRGLPVCQGDYFFDGARLTSLLNRRGLILLEDFLRQENDISFKSVLDFKIKSLTPPATDGALCGELSDYTGDGFACVLYGGSAARGSFLPQLFSERGIPCAYAQNADEVSDGIVTILGRGFPCGFEDRQAAFALVGSTRLSGVASRRKGRFAPGEKISGFSDIAPGDYIVHQNYGIGIYEGIHKVESQGAVKDFIKIRYAGTDTLFIPCGQFDLISKYVGATPDVRVKLNKLGTGEWARAKARVSANVKDLAKQLIALYSARKALPGHAFAPDGDWQRAFESAFEFEDTDDQRQCCEQIKADMERPWPMDRLLCGDVGFGKTEVALRAAYKCVLDSRQVAFLTPTTILAWQHFNTMRRRFEGFPVTVELLSRFRSPAQQEVILRRLRRGEIDIVVGTHRLIQKDVKFKELGLVVVDEEQRFGVTHKEALKEMSKSVDVLTLTATPIPRTLNMALSGIRDMSVIESPPLDRHPVSTYVCEYDRGIITDALRREVARGGQCYYLYNRVETIYRTAQRIADDLPGAAVEVAHGQMAKEELSDIWDRMTEGKIDILVCTTIIETGVDVPNANTLVIEDADRLGLAQLHQIRGRVGRSYKRAYAYFTYRAGRSLSEDGRKRLDAIREYTEFGSGFKIAMRDLQIRGAGNLLGAQQHGHMDSVGYDMYMQLLSRAIAEEKGEKLPPAREECVIDLKADAYIPDSYIDSSALRVDMYKKIAAVENETDRTDIIDELIDRFSDPPERVMTLLDVALVRANCLAAGVRELKQTDSLLQFYLHNNDFSRIADIIAAFSGKMYYSAGTRPYLSCRLDGDPVACALTVSARLRDVCRDLDAARANAAKAAPDTDKEE